MKYISSALLFAACALGANAQLIPFDYKTAGDALLARDLSSGLDWLKLTQTAGMTANNVKAQLADGGLFEGFRFATRTEFTAMCQDYFAAQPASIAAIDQARALHGLLGGATVNLPGYATILLAWGWIAEDADEILPVPPGIIRRGDVVVNDFPPRRTA